MGKALSDAFVLVLDGKVPKGDAGEAEEPCFFLLNAKKALSEENIPSDKMLSEGAFYDGLKVTAEHIEESVADRISKMPIWKARTIMLFSDGCQPLCRGQDLWSGTC